MPKLSSEVRKAQILKAASTLSKHDNYVFITRGDIAAKAGVSTGTVSKYLGDMGNVRKEVMRYAVKNEILKVIFQGLANSDPIARRAPEYLKLRAMQSI